MLDWSAVPERAKGRAWPGPRPHPRTAYIKALLVKLQEGKPYVSQLRRFLVAHPVLVLLVGFVPQREASQPYGFNVETTVPCERWLRAWQQHLDNAGLQGLLTGTVHSLQAEIPGLGMTVAIKSMSGGMAPAWPAPPTRATGMWSWPNTLSPLMKAT